MAKKVTNTVLDAKKLIPVLRSNYGLDKSIDCQLIRNGFNHNYLIEAGNQRYVLKIYLNNKYYIQSADDFRFELDLVTFLFAQGIPVAPPIANKGGQTLTTAEFQKETRHMALFRFAEGERLQADVQEEEVRWLGEIVASLHLAADKFQSRYSRYHLDLNYLLDEPVGRLEKHLIDGGKGDLEFFRPFAEKLRKGIARLSQSGNAYGIIHADLNSSNIFYDPEAGFTIFDFDHCAFGWRAYDLVPFKGLEEIRDTLWKTFLEGYESVRPLSKLEKNVIPVFNKLRATWDIGDMLNMMPVWGEKPDEEYLDGALELFRHLMDS